MRKKAQCTTKYQNNDSIYGIFMLISNEHARIGSETRGLLDISEFDVRILYEMKKIHSDDSNNKQ